MSSLFRLTDARMAHLESFFRRATASRASMIGMLSLRVV